ncbi:protein CREG1-like [Diadema setosum]|uniref:protein CREG1-like n=1 Tax=Diadema setosum TaxID=31175 RepID=UPI003B3A446D
MATHWVLAVIVLWSCSLSVASGRETPSDNAIKLVDLEPSVESTRPPYYDKAKRARYMVHKANWGVIATVSTKPEMLGRPFPAPNSLADGPVGNGSGTPYFYLAMIDSTMHDVAKNPNVSVTLSEAEFSDIADCAITSKSDPENPLCARLVLLGKFVEVTDSTEKAFAKNALFSRHPLMPSWPSSHDFRIIKLDIDVLWIIDFYGGGTFISVQDYYNANL